MSIDISNLIPAARASEMIGNSPTTKGANVSAKARAGKIPGAVKVGRDWFVPLAWAEAEAERRKKDYAEGKKRGRPRQNTAN
jgi:hypothetical protein